jgi:UbiD family decarboxylase
MDSEVVVRSLRPARDASAPLARRDLCGWLDLIEREGNLKRIGAQVDPNEELAAVTFLASRQPDSPALLFENLVGDTTRARILTNMLGASKERYALAVGLDPQLSVAEMIAATRTIMTRTIKPVHIPKEAAPVNEVIVTGDAIDLTCVGVTTAILGSEWPIAA